MDSYQELMGKEYICMMHLLLLIDWIVFFSSYIKSISRDKFHNFFIVLVERIPNAFIFILRYRISCIINLHSSGNARVGSHPIFSASYGRIGISPQK
jgi:hypothetical protein